MTGSSAILPFWQTVLKSNWTAHTFQVASARALTDTMIVATAQWSAEMTDADRKVTSLHGETAQVFVKAGEGWKIKLVAWHLLK